MTNIGRFLAAAAVLGGVAAGGRADDAAAGRKAGEALVGTWKLKSAKYGGNGYMFPAGTTMVKHVTPVQFFWTTYDEEGTILRAAGGGYTLKEDLYVETPEYGVGEAFQVVKGKPQSFRWKIVGDEWRHVGTLSNGLTVEEVWKRVEKKP